MGRAAPAGFSGFGPRLAAAVVDTLLTTLCGMVLVAVVGTGLAVAIYFVAARSLDANNDIPEQTAVFIAALVGAGSLAGAALFLALVLAYFVLFTGLRGQTPGKMLLGIRVVDERGALPGLRRAIMREIIGKLISSTILYIGFLAPLWDRQRQAWHDKIAGTYVVPAAGSDRRVADG